MYDDIPVDDQMKSRATLMRPDSRVGPNRDQGEYFDQMNAAELSPTVPSEIRIQLDVARNIFLFSYFSYRLGMAAKFQALATLERALYQVIEGPKPFGEEYGPTLGPLLRKALDQDLLCDDALPNDGWGGASGPEGKERCRRLFTYWVPEKSARAISRVAGVRNSLAHHPRDLDLPGECATTVIQCAALINYLFRNPGGQP